MTRYTNRRVGETAKDLILAGFNNADIVRIVRQMIDGCRITAKNVSFYRWQLKQDGYVV